MTSHLLSGGLLNKMILACNLFMRIFRGLIFKTKSRNIKGINFCEKMLRYIMEDLFPLMDF